MTDQSTETLFTEEKKAEDKPATAAADQPKVVEPSQPDLNAIFKEQLKSITDEGGEQKYKDVMTALEALKHSQEYIQTLQEENKTYRETKLEQDTLNAALQNISAKPPVQEPTSQETKIDAEQLKGLTLETLMEYEKTKAAEANKKAVESALTQHYGDQEKAKKAIQDKAEELGVDVSTISTLAAQSPKAALAYFNVTQASGPKPSKEGTINTEAFLASQKPQEVDYTARYTSSSSPTVSKWHEAGKTIKS